MFPGISNPESASEEADRAELSGTPWSPTSLSVDSSADGVAHKHVILGSEVRENWTRGINHLRNKDKVGIWAVPFPVLIHA